MEDCWYMCIEKRKVQLVWGKKNSQKNHLIWDGGSISSGKTYLVSKV